MLVVWRPTKMLCFIKEYKHVYYRSAMHMYCRQRLVAILYVLAFVGLVAFSIAVVLCRYVR